LNISNPLPGTRHNTNTDQTFCRLFAIHTQKSNAIAKIVRLILGERTVTRVPVD
jgi:hypothetical protein